MQVYCFGPTVDVIVLKYYHTRNILIAINVSTDIDECTTAAHNCHGVANCYNNEGSFTCQCRDSYTGDGILNCDPVGEWDDF